MPVTPQQIAAATDSLALQRLQATIQNEAAADQADTNAKVEADIAARALLAQENAATWKRQATAAESMIAAFQAQAAQLHTRDQGSYLSLYEMHLKTRLGPTIVSTATVDAVLDDIVKDAVRMTGIAWPLLKPELDKLV
jgi:hypothetical protein